MQALVSTMMNPTSLFTVRRLAELGFQVTAIDSSRECYAFYSRAVKRRIISPSLRYDPRGFARVVLNELKTGNYDIYVPTFECGFLMSYYYNIIKNYTRMLTMPYESIMKIHNKEYLKNLAERLNIPTPAGTFCPKTMDEVKDICQSIDYPVIIKHQTGRNANGQRLIKNPAEVYPQYQEITDRYNLKNELPIIQRFIKGPLISTINLARQGDIVGNIVFKSLRVVPTTGGTSSYRVTYSCPEAEEMDRRIIEHFNWTGFISLDYMMDEETGNIYLIECNPRMAPAVALAYNAGVNLIEPYVDMILDQPIRNPKPQIPGIKGKLQFLDLGWILFNLTDNQLSLKEKWKCFKEWARPEKFYYDMTDLRDFKPILALYAFIFRRIFKFFGPEAGEIFLENVMFEEKRFNGSQETESYTSLSSSP